MHPAPSIIVFTVLSGLGYGLAFVLGLGLLDPAALATKAAHVAALALIAAGLLSSTLHLGNPQRAWRAFSQWRSSWLSREGVASVVTFVPLTIAASASLLAGRTLPAAGLLGSLGAAVTVYCTSMIYASLRSIDAWHTPLTSACYLLFALAGGLLASSFCALASGGPNTLPWLAAAAILAAWIVKWAWRARLLEKRLTSTPETATGLGNLGKVRLFERPHMTENYLTNEMGFRIARKHAGKLFAIAFGLGGVLPALLAALAGLLAGSLPFTASFLMLLALSAYVPGLFIERWLFFAEARHAVMNYYGG